MSSAVRFAIVEDMVFCKVLAEARSLIERVREALGWRDSEVRAVCRADNGFQPSDCIALLECGRIEHRELLRKLVVSLPNEVCEFTDQLFVVQHKGDGLFEPIPAHEFSNSFRALGMDSHAFSMPRSSVSDMPGKPLMSTD